MADDHLTAAHTHDLTPRQADVLAAVARGEIWRSSVGRTNWQFRDRRTWLPTARALRDHGLVAEPPMPGPWMLTDTGRAVLDQHRRAEP